MRFIKAQADGNDFVIVESDAIVGVRDMAAFARRACDRHRGVGADGLMTARLTTGGAAMDLFNADGSRSEISGNGIRCLAAWLSKARRLSVGASVIIETMAGPKALSLRQVRDPEYQFRAAMGPPEELRQERLEIAGQIVTAVVMRVGNPQCVVLGPLTEARLHTIASALAVHPFFPEGTNVELAAVEAPDRVRMLIWERGVGPTESSGTGACAAAVAAAAYGGAARAVDVVAPGGTQRVEWQNDGIWLTGWAEVVATGELVQR